MQRQMQQQHKQQAAAGGPLALGQGRTTGVGPAPLLAERIYIILALHLIGCQTIFCCAVGRDEEDATAANALSLITRSNLPLCCCAVGKEGADTGEAAAANPPLGLSQGHMNGAGPAPPLADGILDLVSPNTSPAKVTEHAKSCAWACNLYSV